MQEKQEGISLHIDYVAPRKRKARTLSFSSYNLEECICAAIDFMRRNGGRVTKAYYQHSLRWFHEMNGEKVWYHSYPLFGQTTPLLDGDLDVINGSKLVGA